MSGSVSKGRDTSQSLQMMERPLLSPDELKTMPKGQFVVMKTGARPMRTRLRLFLEWGIEFGEPYAPEERAHRPVAYADKAELERSILRSQGLADFYEDETEDEAPPPKPPKRPVKGVRV